MEPTTLAITILGLLAILLIVKESVLGLVAWRRFRAARFARRCEVTQRYFAEARNTLMQAVVAGDLPSDTNLFRVLYYINTAFIRRPDEYTTLSAQIRDITKPGSDRGLSQKMAEEVAEVGAVGKQAIEATVRAFDHIVIDYSFLWRNIYRLEKRSNPHISPFVLLMMFHRYYHEAQKKNQYEAEIQETKRQLHRLAMT